MAGQRDKTAPVGCGVAGASCRSPDFWRLARSALATWGCLAVAAGSADAQVVDAEVGVSAGVTYDTNVLRLADDLEPAPGEARSDVVQEYGVSGEVGVNLGLQRLFVAGGAARSIYRENDQLNDRNVDVLGGLQWQVTSRCAGELAGQYRQVPTDLDLLEEPVRNTETTVAVVQTAECRVGGPFQVGVDAFWRRTSNSLEDVAASDSREWGVSGSWQYERPPLSAAGLEIGYTNTTFPDRPAGGDLPADLSQINAVVTVGRRITPTLAFDVSGGASFVTGIGDTSPFPLFGLDLEWNATPKLVWTVFLGRTVAPPTVVEAAIATETDFGLELAWAYSPKLDLDAGVAYSRRTFEDDAPGEGLTEDREDDAFRASLGANYVIYRNLTGFLRYEYLNQSSTDDDATFAAQRVSLGLAFTY